jgi:hypothetical protein
MGTPHPSPCLSDDPWSRFYLAYPSSSPTTTSPQCPAASPAAADNILGRFYAYDDRIV